MKKTALALLVFTLLVPACVPKSQLLKAKKEGFAEADRQCLELQARLEIHIGGLQTDLAAKNERLRRFNQLNEDSTLRTKTSDDSKGWDDKDSGSFDADNQKSGSELLKSAPMQPLNKPADPPQPAAKHKRKK